jgi:quinol monooxygenase YgiN
MIVEYIRYDIPAHDAEAFEADYVQTGHSLDASSHCLDYELSRCVDEPASYILRIAWDSVEGHVQGFRQSEEFRQFFAAIKPWVGRIQEMRHYQQTATAMAKTR